MSSWILDGLGASGGTIDGREETRRSCAEKAAGGAELSGLFVAPGSDGGGGSPVNLDRHRRDKHQSRRPRM